MCIILRHVVLLAAAAVLLSPHAYSGSDDVARFLGYGRSSDISRAAKGVLNSKIDMGTLTPERIREVAKSPEVAELCYLDQFFSQAGSVRSFVQGELGDKEFVAWLASHEDIFKQLAHSGGGSKETLGFLYKVWKGNNKTLSNVEISMALGAGLIADKMRPDDCLAKFEFYRTSFNGGKCHPQAGMLAPWEWAIVLRGRESIPDLTWAQEFIEPKNIKPEKAGSRFAGFIPYRKENEKGVSIHKGSAFYDHKPITLKLYTEYSGVCGAVSSGASGFLRAKGVPAYTIGQPGHCAFLWKNPKGNWEIGNNISGWNWSTGKSQLPWGGPVAFHRTYNSFLGHPNADESRVMYYLSFCTQKPENAELLLREAVAANPYNYPAWQRYLTAKAKNATDEQKMAYLKEFAKAMPDENNMIWHVAQNVLKIKEKRVNPYELYACVVGPNCTRDAEEFYTRQVWNKLVADCPQIKPIAEYKAGFLGKHLTIFVKESKYVKWSSKMRKSVASMLEEAIKALTEQEKTRAHYIEIYKNMLEIWNDKAMDERFVEFMDKVPSKRGS